MGCAVGCGSPWEATWRAAEKTPYVNPAGPAPGDPVNDGYAPTLLIIVDDEQGSGALPLINPVITAQGGPEVGEEGCLSIPGIFAPVERAEWVWVEALDQDGSPLGFQARGLRARVIQHEIDHLDGILFIDRLDPVTRDRIKRKIRKEGLPAEAPARHAFAL